MADRTNKDLAAQGYKFVRWTGRRDGSAVFLCIDTGAHELFMARAGGYAGWCLDWRGTSWEFCHSI